MNKESKTQATTMEQSKLHHFFVEQLQDIYWAEKKLVKTLPKLEAAATTNELKKIFADHLLQTKKHVSRLENVFDLINEEAKGQNCPAMAGIVEEGEDIIDETETGTAQRDVGLIFAAQKAEHYEIATYGGLVELAKTMGHDEAAEMLNLTLSEEKEADALLTSVAQSKVNKAASQEAE